MITGTNTLYFAFLLSLGAISSLKRQLLRHFGQSAESLILPEWRFNEAYYHNHTLTVYIWARAILGNTEI